MVPCSEPHVTNDLTASPQLEQRGLIFLAIVSRPFSTRRAKRFNCAMQCVERSGLGAKRQRCQRDREFVSEQQQDDGERAGRHRSTRRPH